MIPLPLTPAAVETAPWGGSQLVICCRTPTYVGVFATTQVVVGRERDEPPFRRGFSRLLSRTRANGFR